MDADFWHRKWEKKEIAFHQADVNPLLVEHFKALSLAKGSGVFVPLCGRTPDISWLLSNGYHVAGAELSKIAIEELFIDLGVEPQISRVGTLDHYSAKDIDIFAGDIFELSSTTLGSVDAIYDRAALVALPEAMRIRYAAHLMAITNKARQLLICYEYDQTLMDGPPFSIDDAKVRQYYSDSYDLKLVASQNVTDGLKGCAAREHVWLLTTEKYPDR